MVNMLTIADRRRYTELTARTQARARNRVGGRADIDWCRFANTAEAATIHLYGDIGMCGTSAQQFVDQLQAITAPAIDLHINSSGGDVFDGLAIYNSLRSHRAQVTVHVDGLAASAASFIAQAGDRIIVARSSAVMIHDASGLCWGNAAEMAEMADLLDKLSDTIADIYQQKAGGTVAQWRERMRATTWYNGPEALADGLADEMTDPDPAAPTDEWSRMVAALAGDAEWNRLVRGLASGG